ncbi:MAG: DUF5711 family protein [Defluviitaleaceae bacterium]|nr:DUF5711 family protein [Defluviitaleaceae bacterium]
MSMDAAKESKRMNTITKVLIAVMLILIAVLVQVFIFSGIGQAREMHMENTGVSVSYEFDSQAVFHSNSSRFFQFVNRDGIRQINSAGNLDWTDTFSFSRPMVTTAGDITAVGDYRGRHVHVYNNAGRIFMADIEYPLLNFTVTETGILTVIVSYGSGFGVHVYTQQDNHFPGAYYWTVHERDGMYIPILAEVSDNGRYIAIAVVDMNVTISTDILFLYTSRADAFGTDRGLFATESFSGQIVTAMQFMDNNRLVVAGLYEIRCFQVGPGHAQVRQVWSEPLHNRLSHFAFYGGSHFAFATDDRFIGIDDGDPVGTVRIFSVNGVEAGVFQLGRRVTHLSTGNSALIVGAERNFHAIDLRGNPLWEHTTLYDTRDVMFLENTDTVLIAGTTSANIYRRRRVREDDRDTTIQDLEFLDSLEGGLQ